MSSLPVLGNSDAKNVKVLLSNSAPKPKSASNRRNYIIGAILAVLLISVALITFKAIDTKQSSNLSMSKALPCPENGFFDTNSDKCVCSSGFYWDMYNFDCKKIAPSGQPWPCPLNAHFDWAAYNCVCNDKFWWDGWTCQASAVTAAPEQSCGSDSHFDWNQYKCVCNDGFHYDDGCKVNAQTTSGCQEGYSWNGWQCEYLKAKYCGASSHFDWNADKCVCDIGFSWKDGSCQSAFTQTQEVASAGTGSRWGSFTNYDPSTGGGYCDGVKHSPDELVVALYTDQLLDNDLCLKYITLYGNGRSVRVQVVDMCNKDHGW